MSVEREYVARRRESNGRISWGYYNATVPAGDELVRRFKGGGSTGTSPSRPTLPVPRHLHPWALFSFPYPAHSFQSCLSSGRALVIKFTHMSAPEGCFV